MKSIKLSIVAMMFTFGALKAQDTIMPLWPNKVPNQINIGETEQDVIEDIRRIRNVQKPTIEVYLPSGRNNTGKAVLLFPGGGYHFLAYDWEGVDFAKALNVQGIAGIVVKYRLPISKSISEKRWEVPLQDAQRAIRLVRSNAKEFNIDPNSLGILGFSAGGHLASTLGVHFDDTVYPKQDEADDHNARPDFMGLVYPVITMDEAYTHKGSRNGLLGDDQSESMVHLFSNELHVDANTPPTFLIHAQDDGPVPIENSLEFYKALHRHNVPSAIHIYPTGGHGFGLGLKHPLLNDWIQLFITWIESLEKP